MKTLIKFILGISTILFFIFCLSSGPVQKQITDIFQQNTLSDEEFNVEEFFEGTSEVSETNEEVVQLFDDLRAAEVDFITIGQYLQPTPKHAEVKRFVKPEEFKLLKDIALPKGFLMVSSSALTRSSYHAGDDFRILKKIREASKENA